MARTMLGWAVKMHRGSRFVAFGWLLPMALLAPAVARGQTTTTTTGPVITAGGSSGIPSRFLPDGTALGQSTRSVNLNPLGINYDDCAKDMRLSFPIIYSGFSGQTLEVWVSNTADCTQPASRGATGVAPTCWEVFQQAGLNNSASVSTSIVINVRDIVGPQTAIPSPGVSFTQQNGEGRGLAACAQEPGVFTAIPMSIYFMAIDSSFSLVGTDYQYGTTTLPFTTDLVGPPAPIGVSKQVGDTLFIVNWTANADSDTAAYDVFIDPIPGQEDAGSSVTTVEVCDDSGSSTTDSGDGSAVSDGDDGSAITDGDGASDASDGTVSTPAGTNAADANCHLTNQTGPSIGLAGSCSDPLLSSAIVSDAGTSSTTVDVFDDAGNLIDASVESGNGGLSTIPLVNLVAPNVDGVTVSDKSGGTFTITGLKNNQYYNVVVAAVDGSGNIGPPSVDVCDYPAPVNDFWTLYKNAGGGAGGGLCALEETGEPVPATTGIAILIGATAIGLQRRRARKQRHAGRDAGTAS